MFAAIHFKNFRGFGDLALEGLKGVNLIVGRNNAGKTSLLEGLFFLGNPHKIVELNHLLRSSNSDFLRWVPKDGTEEVRLAGRFSKRPISVALVPRDKPLPPDHQQFEQQPPGFRLGLGPFPNTTNSPSLPLRGHEGIRFQILSVRERSLNEVVRLFGLAVKQRGGEARIENLLRQVDNRFVKIRVDPSTEPHGSPRNDLVVDLGLSEMIPIFQAGQGLYRLVSIFAELVGGQPQVCIVDEIENGLHHSILEDVWAGLAAVSRELNIQIFATTHSYECILAAHNAFSRSADYDFSIIQLFRDSTQAQGRVLDRKHIEAAMIGEIDLR